MMQNRTIARPPRGPAAFPNVNMSSIVDSNVHAFTIRLLTAVLIIAAAGLVPNFLYFGNLQSIMYSVAAIGVAAVGMSLVTLSGNLFMLSMGATTALSTAVFAAALHLGLGSALLLVLAIGGATGILQGVLIAIFKTNPIITTIAMSSVITGLGVLWTGGLTVIGVGDAHLLGSARLFGILPTQIVVMAIFAAVVGLLVERSRLGAEIRLLGMSPEAARLAGLRVRRALLTSYGIAGVAAGLAGCLIASTSAQGNLTYGIDIDFNAIAAILVGGVSIRGGRGKVSDAVVGAIFLGVIGNILLVSGVRYEYQLVVKGLVVFCSVIFGALALRRLARRQKQSKG